MFSAEQISTYSELTASWACGISHGVASGHEVGVIANTTAKFIAATSVDELSTEIVATVRCDHLFERQPEILPLLHLPLGAIAMKRGGEWHIGEYQNSFRSKPMKNQVTLVGDKHIFLESDDPVFVLAGRAGLYFQVFQFGTRFVPYWTEREHAKKKLNLNFLDRLLFRIKRLERRELVKQAVSEKHNYIATEVMQMTWASYAVDELLHLEVNALRL